MSAAHFDPDERPFGVVIREPEPVEFVAEAADEGWSEADLEAEYLRAVEAAEQAELISELTFDELGSTPVPVPDVEAAAEVKPAPAVTPAPPSPAPEGEAIQLSQVLEALTFVGGAALTTRRLSEILNTSPAEVDELIRNMNSRYGAEGRPYDIQFSDNGYQLRLKSEFESVRDRVHGHAPKEVRLSPAVLEILALIAYEQPVSREQLAETGKEDADSIARQLIRRDLVAIDRGPEGKEVRYRTTTRFLELFSLRSLNDLPRADDMRFK